MIFNPNGQVLAGVAGVPASIDRQTIVITDPAVARVLGYWVWLNGKVAMGQVTKAAIPAVPAVPATPETPETPAIPAVPEHEALWTSEGLEVYDRGAFFLAASGTGAWATEYMNSWAGYWGSSVPVPRPCAGGDGFLAIIVDYQAGKGIRVYRDDGSVALDLPDANPWVEPRFSCRIHDGILAFLDGKTWRIFDLRTSVELPYLPRHDGVDWFVPAVGPDGVYVFERDYAGMLTVRRSDSWQARVVAHGPSDERYSPDMVVVDEFRFGWSRTEAEQTTDLDLTDIADLSTLPVIDVEHRAIQIDPTPPVLRPLPTVPATMPSFWIGRDIWKVADNNTVGNCSWTERDGVTEPSDLPVAEGSRWAAGVAHRPLLTPIWLSDGNADPLSAEGGIDREIAYADLRGAHAVFLHQDDHSETQWNNCRISADRVSANGKKPVHSRHVVLTVPELTWLPGCLKGLTVNLQTIGRDWNQVRQNAVDAVLNHMAKGTIEEAFFIRWNFCQDAELLDWLSQVAALVKRPLLQPGQLPPVVVDPEPEPPPAENPPRDGLSAAEWALIAAVTGSAVAKLIAILKKRRSGEQLNRDEEAIIADAERRKAERDAMGRSDG